MPNHRISSSQIAIAGFGVSTVPAQYAKTDGQCKCCGKDIKQGEAVGEVSTGKSFTDWTDFYAGDYVCISCTTAFTGDFMKIAKSAVVNKDGAWSLSKDENRKWLLLDPPEPPFVAFIATTMSQHLAWKAKPTLDKDRIALLVGKIQYMIDRPLLLQCVEDAKELVDWVRLNGKIKITPNHPYAALSRDGGDERHGTIRRDIEEFVINSGDQKMIAILNRLRTLGEGELLGMAVLAKQKQEATVKLSLTENR